MTEAAEIDRCNNQEKIMSTRDTSMVFKLLKSLNKSPNLPKILINGGRSASNIEDKVNLINNFFHSVYTPKHSCSIKNINSMKPTLQTSVYQSKKLIEYNRSSTSLRLEALSGTPYLLPKNSESNE